jgi:hypothetical protein
MGLEHVMQKEPASGPHAPKSNHAEIFGPQFIFTQNEVQNKNVAVRKKKIL